MSESNESIFILACNPHKDSFSVTGALHFHNHILNNLQIPSSRVHYCYLDDTKISPLLSQKEINETSNFDSFCLEHQIWITRAHTLALFYPDWWGMPPALLVGWLQKIFSPGIAFQYEGEDFVPKTNVPLLTNLRIILSVSSNENSHTPVEQSCNLLKDRVFTPSGIKKVHYNILLNTHHSSVHQRKKWMERTIDFF